MERIIDLLIPSAFILITFIVRTIKRANWRI